MQKHTFNKHDIAHTRALLGKLLKQVASNKDVFYKYLPVLLYFV